MILLFLILGVFIAQIVQSQVLPVLGVRLDLFLVITIYAGFLYGLGKGIEIGLLAGLLQDIFSFGQIGLGTVGLVACGLVAGYCKRMLLLRYWFIRIFLVFGLTILNLIIYFSIARILSQDVSIIILKANWFSIAIGNTIVSGFIFWLVDRYG